MRIRPAETGGAEPCVHIGPGTETVRINNRGPGEKYEFEAREIVDGGFLELVRYGLRKPDDPMVVATVKVTDGSSSGSCRKGRAFAATTTMATGTIGWGAVRRLGAGLLLAAADWGARAL